MDSVQACEAWYIGSIPIERTTFLMAFLGLGLLASAAQAQPAATLDQLKARQAKERQELQAGQKLSKDQLRKTTAEDQQLFKHRQKLRKGDFKEELEKDKDAFAASLQGLPKDERKLKKAESKARLKQKQAEFKRSLAQEGERFYHDLQAKWDFLKEVQGKETRQLEEKQRSELEHFQP